MKNLIQALVISICCFIGNPHVRLRADEVDPFAEPGEKVASEDYSIQARVTVEIIEVPHGLLNDLLFGPKSAPDDTALHGQVRQLVAEGKASLFETMLAIAPQRSEARTESAEEFVYPTEYEPAELSNTLQVDGKNESAAANKERRVLATGPTPTSFDSRNLGSMLNISPDISEDGKWVHLTLDVEIVHHQGNRVWAEWKGAFGNSPVQMPIFTSHQVNTNVTLAASRPLLVAVLSPRGDDGFPDFTRKWMVFAKADVIRASGK